MTQMMKSMVTLEMAIEDIVEKYPEAVGFLSERGVRCIRCGEPLWCALGELLKEDEIKNPKGLVKELNKYLEKIKR
jgi:hypothetical protein